MDPLDERYADAVVRDVALYLRAQRSKKLMRQHKHKDICAARSLGSLGNVRNGHNIFRQFDPRKILDVFVLLVDDF